jgi:hypothetical protein
MSFSTLQIKINRNPAADDLSNLEQVLPSKEVKHPEVFYPALAK